MKTHSTENRCVIGPENILFLRRVCATFGPENLQAGAVKGLRAHNKHEEYECCMWQVRESWVYLLTFHTLCVLQCVLSNYFCAPRGKFASLINEYRWIAIAASGLIGLTLVVACFIMHSIFTSYKKKNSDSSKREKKTAHIAEE